MRPVSEGDKLTISHDDPTPDRGVADHPFPAPILALSFMENRHRHLQLSFSLFAPGVAQMLLWAWKWSPAMHR
jgi:hypothetical protein